MVAFVWSYICALAFAGTSLAARFPVDAWKDAAKQNVAGNAVPNKFIVEVADPSDIPTRRGLVARDVSDLLQVSMLT